MPIRKFFTISYCFKITSQRKQRKRANTPYYIYSITEKQTDMQTIRKKQYLRSLNEKRYSHENKTLSRSPLHGCNAGNRM